VKVFNTGKLKIPGVQNENMLSILLNYIKTIFQPYLLEKIDYKQKCDTVLINSNFNCGFYINQDVLYNLLKYKYNLQCIYDPCYYPGLQCKFYYNYITENMSGQQINNLTIKQNKKSKDNVILSIMIFRTGSILISGNCEEIILNKIYNFIKNLLTDEYEQIYIPNFDVSENKNKNKKMRKKNILINKEYKII
jgi:hypothetical protein